MASIIRIRRSTGTLAPSILNYGELAYTTGVGTHGNRGQRLFIGDNASNSQIVGGQYYTDLLSNPPGAVDGRDNPTTPNNGFVAVLDTTNSGYVGDGNLVSRLPRVDQWTVDNITIDGNTIYSNTIDGHIIIRPNGTGRVVFLDDDELQFGSSDDIRASYDTLKDALFFERGAAGNTADIRVADDIQFQFGTDNDSRIYYDEASTDRLVIEGASWTYANSVAQVAITTNTTSSNTSTGALVVGGGVGIASDLNVGGDINVLADVVIDNTLTVKGNTYLGDNLGGTVDLVTILGDISHIGNSEQTGISTITGALYVDAVGINSNTIFTRPGSGDTLFIDPYPDGLSSEGYVVIKGNLQVDGTTTTVNSSTVSVNDAILELGEVTSIRTVMSNALAGVTTIRLDSVTGINTGDVVSNNSALSPSGVSTVTGYDTVNKIITIQDTILSPGISSTTQLTITHAYDTNTDRGISFSYNTSSGTSNNKVGFFGYHDTTNTGSQAPERSWTYIPDASITNSVVTGVRGYLDIKGIYYQTGDFSTHGIVYFDSTGLQNSTTAPSAATFTSTQLLTAVTEITIDLPSAYTVIAGQQVTQVNNSAAYGMVKTSSIGTTITLIGVQGTFDTTNDLKVEGVNISLVPSTINTIYTSKPTWTTSIDGGTF